MYYTLYYMYYLEAPPTGASRSNPLMGRFIKLKTKYNIIPITFSIPLQYFKYYKNSNT